MNTRQPPLLARRTMGVADIDLVVAVEAAAYAFPWSRGNFIDSLAAGYAAELLHDGAGGVLGYFVAMSGVDELHLLNITVAVPHQGCGLGSLLLDRVEQLAREAGQGRIWLEVRASNTRARGLYRRRGFNEVCRRKAYYPAAGAREDAIVMSLTLQPTLDAVLLGSPA